MESLIECSQCIQAPTANMAWRRRSCQALALMRTNVCKALSILMDGGSSLMPPTLGLPCLLFSSIKDGERRIVVVLCPMKSEPIPGQNGFCQALLSSRPLPRHLHEQLFAKETGISGLSRGPTIVTHRLAAEWEGLLWVAGI